MINNQVWNGLSNAYHPDPGNESFGSKFRVASSQGKYDSSISIQRDDYQGWDAGVDA